MSGFEFDPWGKEDDPDDIDDSRDGILTRFPRLDIAALLRADRPAREWVVDGLMPAGTSIAIVAPAGTGKSLFLQAACIAIARGDRTFAGLPIKKRRVLLVDMENPDDELADRFTALGVTADTVDQLEDLIPIHLPPLAPLDTQVGALELAAILDAYDIQRGDVVVLDSLQRVIQGPENDSDTLRAYERHTARMLKKRGVTVIRTDNTGKDTDRGARGTSGKKDDVDVELMLSLDVEKNQLRIKPGKTRMPGIEPVLIDRAIDDDGLLTFSTAGDPFRAAVLEAEGLLNAIGLPLDAGEKKAADALKRAGHKVTRTVLRTAIKERKDPLKTAPSLLGAPSGEVDDSDPADLLRRTLGAVEIGAEKPLQYEGSQRAAHERRTDRAFETDAPEPGAPPLPLSKSGAPAHSAAGKEVTA